MSSGDNSTHRRWYEGRYGESRRRTRNGYADHNYSSGRRWHDNNYEETGENESEDDSDYRRWCEEHYGEASSGGNNGSGDHNYSSPYRNSPYSSRHSSGNAWWRDGRRSPDYSNSSRSHNGYDRRRRSSSHSRDDRQAYDDSPVTGSSNRSHSQVRSNSRSRRSSYGSVSANSQDRTWWRDDDDTPQSSRYSERSENSYRSRHTRHENGSDSDRRWYESSHNSSMNSSHRSEYSERDSGHYNSSDRSSLRIRVSCRFTPTPELSSSRSIVSHNTSNQSNNSDSERSLRSNESSHPSSSYSSRRSGNTERDSDNYSSPVRSLRSWVSNVSYSSTPMSRSSPISGSSHDSSHRSSDSNSSRRSWVSNVSDQYSSTPKSTSSRSTDRSHNTSNRTSDSGSCETVDEKRPRLEDFYEEVSSTSSQGNSERQSGFSHSHQSVRDWKDELDEITNMMALTEVTHPAEREYHVMGPTAESQQQDNEMSCLTREEERLIGAKVIPDLSRVQRHTDKFEWPFGEYECLYWPIFQPSDGISMNRTSVADAEICNQLTDLSSCTTMDKVDLLCAAPGSSWQQQFELASSMTDEQLERNGRFKNRIGYARKFNDETIEETRAKYRQQERVEDDYYAGFELDEYGLDEPSSSAISDEECVNPTIVAQVKFHLADEFTSYHENYLVGKRADLNVPSSWSQVDVTGYTPAINKSAEICRYTNRLNAETHNVLQTIYEEYYSDDPTELIFYDLQVPMFHSVFLHLFNMLRDDNGIVSGLNERDQGRAAERRTEIERTVGRCVNGRISLDNLLELTRLASWEHKFWPLIWDSLCSSYRAYPPVSQLMDSIQSTVNRRFERVGNIVMRPNFSEKKVRDRNYRDRSY